MGLSDVYKNITTDYNVQTAVYRFWVVSKVCGMKDTDEVREMPQNDLNKINFLSMTETLERLLFLYGAGIIDFKTIDRIHKIKDQQEMYERERFPADKLSDVILCSALSKVYAGKDCMTFDDVRNLCSLDSIKIVNGCIKVADKELMDMLLDLGEFFQN